MLFVVVQILECHPDILEVTSLLGHMDGDVDMPLSEGWISLLFLVSSLSPPVTIRDLVTLSQKSTLP